MATFYDYCSKGRVPLFWTQSSLDELLGSESPPFFSFHFDVASGTDDDFPPPHQNRMSRGGRISGNGRPAAVASMPYPRAYEDTDMEAKIHQLEQEAYSSILRAFKAQADAISWVNFFFDFCIARIDCFLDHSK